MKNFITLSFFFAAPLVFATPFPAICTIENDQSSPKTETIVTLEHRPASPIYSIGGLLRQRDVEGAAYLEMWNIMPDGNRYFSRKYLSDLNEPDKDGWQYFTLHFNLMDTRPEIVKLEINIVLPGKGSVELQCVGINDTWVTMSSEWFNGRTAGFIGGALGTFWGFYGALLAFVGSVIVPRGKGRKLMEGMLAFALGMGIIKIVAGIVAIALGQPPHVWLLFIILGAMLVVVPLCFSFKITLRSCLDFFFNIP